MATEATDEGNGLWLPLSELARSKGVTKGPLSRRIARLEAQGVHLSKPGSGGQKLINVAAFDTAVGQSTDIVRATNGGSTARGGTAKAGNADGDELIYAREQARNAAYQADLRKLDLDERLGKLLPVDDVVTAMTQCAEALVRVIDSLPAQADDIASAVARDGATGARRVLKEHAHLLRETLAREMRLLEQQGAERARAASQMAEHPAP